MIWFIISIVAVLVAVGALVMRRLAKRDGVDDAVFGTTVVAVIALVVALIMGFFSVTYTQDAGEAKVQRTVTGSLVGQSTEAGLHFKAPWVSALTFDVRNNTVTYVGDGSSGDHSGGDANGPQITFQDREGVTGNLDVVVRYSLNPASVLDVYEEFQTQENFVNKVITNDVRSIVRNVPSKYSTIEVFSNRGTISTEIRSALEERWADRGIIVEEVSLQEIRYSDEVKARFDEAQASRIAESKAQADQEVARVNAETKVIEAEAAAKANEVLTQSLTPEVLQQKYIDALSKSSTIYVVPEGSTPLVQTGPAQTPLATP